MDVGDRDKVETDHKGDMDVGDRETEGDMSYNTSRSNSEWQPSGATFTNFLMGMVTDGNPLAVCKGDVANPSPLISVSDSLGPAPALWEHPANNDHSGTTAFDKLGLTRLPGPLGAGFEARWEPPNSESKSGIFVPTGSGVFPHSISQFPADSAFIERAARFSCFSTGNIADMVDPYGVNQPVSAYHQVGMMPQDPHVIFGGSSARATSSGGLQKNEVNPASAPKGGSLSADHRSQEGSPNKLEKKNGGIDVDTKQAGSDTVNSVGGGGQEETSLVDTGAQPSSAKGLDTKKRKRGGQDTEQPQQPLGEDVKNNGKHDSEAPPSNRAKFENGKQSSQASDPPKEEYLHIRARRGQATNSHSLAERVRREKISERMKFLQDLVPGCSKVTGKAVMLDEIINYVQSLQRQVEFLSMKLATVNPKLDFNIESLLAKDQMFGGRAGPPIMGFSADMPVVYPQLHPSQPTVIPPNLPVISSQLTSIREVYKEATPQVHSFWDDELHNVVQMGFNSSTPPDNQDANSSVPPGQTKVEH